MMFLNVSLMCISLIILYFFLSCKYMLNYFEKIMKVVNIC